MPADQPPTQPAGRSYRRDIDGLRSIAVLAVVAYHAGLSWLPGGFAGVDIFFVISGFLITSLILQEQFNNSFTLRNFYIRRARRLFPALFAVLTVSTVAAWWLLMPGEMEDFGESLATSAAFSSNFMFWSEAGYFDGPSEFKPLLHTWSLAIEEQYYLLFPLLLLACKSSGRYLAVLTLVALASLAISQWYVNHSPAAAFFLLPHRLWQLMVGSLLAVAAIRHSHWFYRLPTIAREALAIVGLVAICITILRFSKATPFPGINALLPTIGTACLIAAGIGGSTAVTRALATPAFVGVGLISYSLYLWHWPVLVFTKLYLIRPAQPLEILTAVVVACILGWLSWRFIERPFRTHRTETLRKTQAKTTTGLLSTGGLLPDDKILRASLACIAILIAIGVCLDQTKGAPGRLPNRIVAIAEIADDKPPERKFCTGVTPTEVSASRLCPLGEGTRSPDFILWGDSHAMTLAPRFAEVATSLNRRGLNATANGCAALLNTYRPADDPQQECAQFNAAVLDVIATTPSITTVVLAGRWGIYAETQRYKHESGQALELAHTNNSDKRALSESAKETSAEVWKYSFQQTLAALEALGKKIVVIASIPEIGWDTPNIIARTVLLDRPVSIAPTVDEFLARQHQVLPVFQEISHPVLHPQDLLCGSSVCRVADGQHPLYIDEDHLSTLGSRTLLPLVRRALVANVEPTPANATP